MGETEHECACRSVPPAPVNPGDGEFEVLTSTGPAAIAIIRLSGRRVPDFLRRHVRTRRPISARSAAGGEVVRGTLVDGAGRPLDDILVSAHADPPVWDLRLHLHGSPRLVRRCAELLAELGFAPRRSEAAPSLWPDAEPLAAEACARLPQMATLRGARWLLGQAARLKAALEALLNEHALDRGRARCAALADRARVFEWFSRAARVALIGPPNSGKSTLANALADQAVSLVSPVPGTTRDWVEIPGQLRGFPVVWLDTAGLRPSEESLEALSISRTKRLMREADAQVVVLDGATMTPGDQAAFLAGCEDVRPAGVVLNKVDLVGPGKAPPAVLPPAWRASAVWVSAIQRTGLDHLSEQLVRGMNRDECLLDLPGAFSDRQVRLLQAAATSRDMRSYRTALRQCLRGTSAG